MMERDGHPSQTNILRSQNYDGARRNTESVSRYGFGIIKSLEFSRALMISHAGLWEKLLKMCPVQDGSHSPDSAKLRKTPAARPLPTLDDEVLEVVLGPGTRSLLCPQASALSPGLCSVPRSLLCPQASALSPGCWSCKTCDNIDHGIFTMEKHMERELKFNRHKYPRTLL